uniref:Uncharacterized protein n=1 Tax=Rhizophora mucronata TaxID=61149 RepID=A0A2P2MVW6_RHIMU
MLNINIFRMTSYQTMGVTDTGRSLKRSASRWQFRDQILLAVFPALQCQSQFRRLMTLPENYKES